MGAPKVFKTRPGIYYIKISRTNKIYIGSGKNLSKRISHHKEDLAAGKHHNNQLQNIYNKYGLVVFEFIPIFYAINMTTVELRLLEREFIDDFIINNDPELLLNETLNTINPMDDPVISQKHRDIMQEIWADKEFVQLRSESRTLANSNPEFKEKMRNITRELHKDPVYKKAITDGIKNKWATDKEFRAMHTRRLVEQSRREIFCYELNLKFNMLKEAICYLQASGFIPKIVSSYGLSKACMGRALRAYKMHWDYFENFNQEKLELYYEPNKALPKRNQNHQGATT
jgi:group I intron endonuclease